MMKLPLALTADCPVRRCALCQGMAAMQYRTASSVRDHMALYGRTPALMETYRWHAGRAATYSHQARLLLTALLSIGSKGTPS